MIAQAEIADFLQAQLAHTPLPPTFTTLLQKRLSAESADTFTLLPLLVCKALGGCSRRVLPIAATWQLLRHAGRLLDDFQDGARTLDGVDARADLNASTGYLLVIGRILATLESYRIDANTAGELRTRIYEEGLHICGGQHNDLTLNRPTLAQCWEIAGAKTGAFCRVACWSGARMATTDETILNAIGEFGYAVGMLNQIRDDMTDLWDEECSDFVQKQAGSLAIGYCRTTLPAVEKEQFEKVLSLAHVDLAARKKAREIIVQSGAALYLAVQSSQYQQAAHTHLATLQLTPDSRHQLTTLIDTSCFYDAI